MSDELSLQINGLDNRSAEKIRPVSKVILARSVGSDGGMIDLFLEHTCHVNFARTASEAYDCLRSEEHDLVIVDSTLLDMDNISAIKLLKMGSACAHMIIRAETDDEIDRILALEMGADECIAFSCSYHEIRARIRAFLRRHSNKSIAPPLWPDTPNRRSASKINFFDWILDKDRCELFSPSGKSVNLTHAEYLIISALFSDPDVIKDRHSLISSHNDADQLYSERALDVFISRIRKKIAKIADEDLIQTVRGKGYKLIRRPTEIAGNS
jgi:DNA-binding response OmpR family regulator